MPMNKQLAQGNYHPCDEERDAITSIMYIDAQEHADARRVQSFENPLENAILPRREQIRDFIMLVCTGEVSKGGTRTLIEATLHAPKVNRFGEAHNEEPPVLISRRSFWANAGQVEPLR